MLVRVPTLLTGNEKPSEPVERGTGLMLMSVRHSTTRRQPHKQKGGPTKVENKNFSFLMTNVVFADVQTLKYLCLIPAKGEKSHVSHITFMNLDEPPVQSGPCIIRIHPRNVISLHNESTFLSASSSSSHLFHSRQHNKPFSSNYIIQSKLPCPPPTNQ